MTYTIFKNQSQLTGVVHEMRFEIELEDFKTRYMLWKNGMLIQEAFPMLNSDEREFIMTGITPEEWNNAFGTCDEQTF